MTEIPQSGFLALHRYPLTLKVVAVCALLCLPSFNSAIEIAPATAEDIKAALGADARGLDILQEELPDLFTLTTSRIDENATRFFVEQFYTDGRWKEGKVIIEYARDLSYTLVSIYDRKGNRQRIYSVKTQYGEHMARTRAKVPDLASVPEDIPVVDEEEPRSPVKAVPPPANTVPTSGFAPASFVWDDEKGDYVQVGAPVQPAAGVPTESVSSGSEERTEPRKESTSSSSKRRRPRRAAESSTPAIETASRAPASESSASGEVWLPTTGKSTSKAAPKGASVAVGGTTWVERKEVRAPEDTPPPPKRAKKTESHREPPKVSPPPEKVVDADDTVPDHPLAKKSKARKPAESKQEPHETRREEPRREEPRREETVVADARPAKHEEPANKELPAGLNEQFVPSTEDLLADEPVVKSSPKSNTKSTAKSEPKYEPKPEAKYEPKPEAKYEPKPVAKYVPEPEPKYEPKSEPKYEVKAESKVETKPDTKPLTSDSDAWVPKAVKTPPPADVVIPETKVAMAPRPPVDNSVENLLRMSEKNKTNVSKDADAWVPKSAVATPTTEAAMNKEIQRARAEEKQRTTVVKKAPIRKDVNNPEEGVLPVSSFEKMTGSMYGRHREYERRFYPGKLAKSKAPKHDFYVDEVDRKKEFHNIYFYRYQKGKPPKLIAVERHQKVSFRSNYDIDKEDKGKISTYN